MLQIVGRDGAIVQLYQRAGEVEADARARLLAALMALVALVTIFLYRNRPLQTTLCNLVMSVGIMFYITLAVKQPVMEWFLALPLAGVLLTFLARKAIVKDEKLVRSLDRIR